MNTTRIRDLLAQTMEDAPNNHEPNFKPEAASRHRWAGTAEMHYERALAHLAAAKWIDAEPPVDEADVDALTQVLLDTRAEADPRLTAEEQYTILARRLLQTGQVQVNRDDG